MKHKYVSKNHLKMLSDATNRMGNNHIAWLIASITSSSLMMTAISTIHLERFEAIVNILLGTFLLISAALVSFTCFSLNLKYFKMEKQFREMQKKAINGDYTEEVMNPKTIKIPSRLLWKSWSMSLPFVILLTLILIEFIVVLSPLF